MDEAHKELVKRLQRIQVGMANEEEDAVLAAIAAIEALAGERNTATANLKGVQQQVRDLVAERDRLKAALGKRLSPKAREKLGILSESMIAMGDGRELEVLLNWYDESRKALGGAS